MSNLLKAGDSEPEQPLREGWLVKQSGGSGGRGRRRSVGEIMKKWDERYFVLTTARLYYFKTMEVRQLPPLSSFSRHFYHWGRVGGRTGGRRYIFAHA